MISRCRRPVTFLREFGTGPETEKGEGTGEGSFPRSLLGQTDPEGKVTLSSVEGHL